MRKSPIILSWIFQIIIFVILAQTLPFKFGGAQESIDLFTELGMEPHGRYITGAFELIACILLLVPRGIIYGAMLTCGLMGGAILGHITKLGFAGDHGLLGGLAIACFVLSLLVLWIRRFQLPLIGKKLVVFQSKA